MSVNSDPIPRKIHRKGNKLEKRLMNLPGIEIAEKYLESLRGFEYTENEPMEYEGDTYEVDTRLSLSYCKKYLITDGTRTKKVPENDIL